MRWKTALAAHIPVLLQGCGGREVPAAPLPREAGVPYTLALKTYGDAYADQPFRLLVSARDASTEQAQILFAEQCRNVVVAQTPALLWIFYDELALKEFGSFAYGARPRPLLCDLAATHCRQARDAFARDGVKLHHICTFRSAYPRE